jgi:hypothetical protein
VNEQPHLTIKKKKRTRRLINTHFIVKWLAVVLIAILIIAALIPIIFKTNRNMDMTQAISNAKQIYLVMKDFEADFGTFPDDTTATQSPALSDFHGSYSNDYLGQLIAGGYTVSEDIFYVRRVKIGMRPDGVISPPSKILEKDDGCGFAYTMVKEANVTRALSTSDNGRLPLLSAVVLDTNGSFDYSFHYGKGGYICVDGSVHSGKIRRSDNKLLIGGGKTLFETGSQTIWGNLDHIILLPQ